MPAEMKREINDRHPLKRMGTAEEVAQTILFLVSDGGSYISGIGIEINGDGCSSLR